jgi:Flp pilus assembly protein TadG
VLFVTRSCARRIARYRGQQGLARTEVVLGLPFALILCLGCVQLGVAFNHYRSVSDAVRVGAETAAYSRSAPDPVALTIAEVRNAASDLEQSKLSVSVASNWAPGDDVMVTARYPYEINVLGLVVKSGFLESRTVERVQ